MLPISNLVAALEAAAARVLSAEYFVVSIPASDNVCFNHLLIVSEETALCGAT